MVFNLSINHQKNGGIIARIRRGLGPGLDEAVCLPDGLDNAATRPQWDAAKCVRKQRNELTLIDPRLA